MTLRFHGSVWRISHWFVGPGAQSERIVLRHFSLWQMPVQCVHNSLFGILKCECGHISEAQEKIPEHKRISLKMSYLHSKVGFVLGIEKLNILSLLKVSMEGMTPSAELVTIRKPTDVADDKCLNILASCLTSCRLSKAGCSVEVTLNARESTINYFTSFCTLLKSSTEWRLQPANLDT